MFIFFVILLLVITVSSYKPLLLSFSFASCFIYETSSVAESIRY